MLYQKILYSTYIASQFLMPRPAEAATYTVASGVQSAVATMMVMSAFQPETATVDAVALLDDCSGSYGDATTACQRFTISTNSQYSGKDDQYCQLDDIHYQNLDFDNDKCWCSATDTCSDNPFAQVWFNTAWYSITHVGVRACAWKSDEHVDRYKVGYHDGSGWRYVGGTSLSSATVYDVSSSIGCGKSSCTNPPAQSIGTVNCQGIRLYPISASTHCSTNMEIYGSPVPAPTNPPTPKPTTTTTTKNPTKQPTKMPTKMPTKNPTNPPTTTTTTKNPTKIPTKIPTKQPTELPTKQPTKPPTKQPTESPTPRPTDPGTILCGTSVSGDYNGGTLSFSVQIPYDGDITFDSRSSALTLTELRNLNPGVLDNGIGDMDSSAGVITLENVVADTYQFTVEFSATGQFAVDTRCTSDAPTKAPTNVPSKAPTDVPTAGPTHGPTENPTNRPTRAPNAEPSLAPTPSPTDVPTKAPTELPTDVPTDAPSKNPTKRPTTDPTVSPSAAPTISDSGEVAEDDQGEDDNSAREIMDEPAEVDDSLLGLGLTDMELLVMGMTALLICVCCAIGLCILNRVRKFKKAQEELVTKLYAAGQSDLSMVSSFDADNVL